MNLYVMKVSYCKWSLLSLRRWESSITFIHFKAHSWIGMCTSWFLVPKLLWVPYLFRFSFKCPGTTSFQLKLLWADFLLELCKFSTSCYNSLSLVSPLLVELKLVALIIFFNMNVTCWNFFKKKNTIELGFLATGFELIYLNSGEKSKHVIICYPWKCVVYL